MVHKTYSSFAVNSIESWVLFGKMSSKSGPWFKGLLSSMEDPNLRVMEDDKVVVIKDKYPKARYHFLVIPKEDIPQIRNVEEKHANLLAHMERVAKNVVEQHKNHNFM